MRSSFRTVPAMLVALAFALPAALAADQSREWQAWIGCWEAADDESGDLIVCVDAPADGDGAEIRTYVDGEVAAVEHMRADGSPAPIEEGGCTGERTAVRSADGSRIFVRSHMDCGEGATRTTAGVMALLGERPEWIEVHSVTAGEREPVLGVQRFVPAAPATLAAHDLDDPAEGRELAVRTARASVTGLDLDDVAEVVHEADAGVARALVAEAGQPFRLDADALRGLRDQGVPPDVLDVLVAVSHPERFEIAGASHTAEETAALRGGIPSYGRRRAAMPFPPYGWRLSSRYFYSTRSPWMYDPYWGGYGIWRGPRVIVVQPSVRDRGRVDPLDGYRPRGETSRAATTRRDTGSSSAGARSDSGTRGGASVTRRGSDDSGGSSSSGRTATRRSGGNDDGS